MYFFHSGIYSQAVFKALLDNGVVQNAFESVQTQLRGRQHTQFIKNDIPTLSLEDDIQTAGGRLEPSDRPGIFLDLHRYMEAVRRGTLFKDW